MANDRIEKRLGLFLIAAIAVLPIIGVDVPRFYGLGPGIIGIIYIALSWFLLKNKPALGTKSLYLPLIFLPLALLSVTWSIAPDVSLERALKLFAVLVPGVIFLIAVTTIRINPLKPYLILLPAALGAAALFLYIELNYGHILYRSLRGIDMHENLTTTAMFNRGTIAITLSLFPVHYILKSTQPSRTIKTGFYATIIAMLVFVESQSAQLAILISLLTFWFFPYRIQAAWYGLIAVVIALVFAAPFLSTYLYDTLAYRLNTMPFFGDGYGYAGGRLEIWDYISRYALQSPLYGHGIEATRTIEDFDSHQVFQENATILHPHNFALQFWMEFGIIGAAVISALLGYLVLLIKKLDHAAQRIALPTFMATLSVAATAYGFWQSWWLGLLFVVAGLCIISVKLYKNEDQL